ncbi:MAG: DUF5777 family beta-barrel protein [Flavobacteriales bacterium]|nr:DUF5777 family beta-barrel protein [Flavobacteriales bacterium]
MLRLKRLKISLACLLGFASWAAAQGGLLGELEKMEKKEKPVREKVYETFFGTRVINGHSVETPLRHSLQFIIAHRFGRVNSGFYQFFGLDQASIRFGFEYGILDRLCLGFGRSTFLGTWDGFVKARILEQQIGKRAIPLSLAVFSSIAVDGRRRLYPLSGQRESFAHRLSYCYQALLARKFGKWLSFQLSPTLVHQNIVKTVHDKNLLFIMGGGTRVRVSPSVAILAEYFYRVGDNPQAPWHNPVALGVDINTGGHVFQIQLTNAQAMFETGFLRMTTGDVLEGDIHLGFNIVRKFGFTPRKSKIK